MCPGFIEVDCGFISKEENPAVYAISLSYTDGMPEFRFEAIL
jgi:hypothetical protein